MSKKNLTFITLLLFICSLTIVHAYDSDIYIDNIKLGDNIEYGLDIVEYNLLNQEVVLVCNNGNKDIIHSFYLKDLGFRLNKMAIINSIHNYKTFNNTIEEIKDLKIKARYIVDKDAFKKIITNLYPIPYTVTKDAKLRIIKDNIQVIPEINSYSIDIDALIDDIQTSNIYKNNLFNIPFKIISPKVVASDLRNLDFTLLSKFTTRYSLSNKPRSSNISLATSLIDGTFLKPGEIFSYNDRVGRRTKEKGFKEAGIYINGKVSKGLGGGICQTSTTLYNAVLYGNLEVLNRSNHSLTVPYVPLSRDATVSYGSQDFVFKNNTNKPLYIQGYTYKNTVTFKIYGKSPDVKITLKSSTLQKEPPKTEYVYDETLLAKDDKVVSKGHTGYTSRLIKEVYKDGSKIESTIVSKDYYRMDPKIIHTGTQKKASL